MTPPASITRAGSVNDSTKNLGETLDESAWEWGPTTQSHDTDNEQPSADEQSSRTSIAESTNESGHPSRAGFLFRTTIGIILVTGGMIMGLESSRVLMWLKEVVLTQTTIDITGALMVSFGVTVLLISKGMSKIGLSAE